MNQIEHNKLGVIRCLTTIIIILKYSRRRGLNMTPKVKIMFSHKNINFANYFKVVSLENFNLIKIKSFNQKKFENGTITLRVHLDKY